MLFRAGDLVIDVLFGLERRLLLGVQVRQVSGILFGLEVWLLPGVERRRLLVGTRRRERPGLWREGLELKDKHTKGVTTLLSWGDNS
mmetsp:Transcript_7598/g.9882  ORF Transcript_7598/g.9882 Transcript_7598/m.9882 type:complete len:87 (-) Transcript_7598:934-1194(-)